MLMESGDGKAKQGKKENQGKIKTDSFPGVERGRKMKKIEL